MSKEPRTTPEPPIDPGQSINEPPGSNIAASPPVPRQAEQHQLEELPSEAELERMKRSELDELAEHRGVDISSASNKEEVIHLLLKAERKRKRT